MRLIDADALKDLITNNVYVVSDCINSRDYGMFWTGGIEKAIDEQPTIDAVEVVRCKDCKHWQDQEEGVVESPICVREQPMVMEIGPYGYCSYGKRREEKR